jgi:hypothetical protein
MNAPLEFLIEALKHVGRLHVLVVRHRQPVIGQRCSDAPAELVASSSAAKIIISALTHPQSS